MRDSAKTALVLRGLTLAFVGLAVVFARDLWSHPVKRPSIPLVDTNFLSTATARLSAADLVRSGGDTSGLECYICHDKATPVKLTFDASEKIILPKEHGDLVMAHGRNNRNNNCFNCHNETNLETLQTRDGRELKITESPQLCGSCHGPTYRDWEAGVHGRTSGYWDRALGPIDRKVCTSCHNPHAPKFQPWKPAPRPHALHPVMAGVGQEEKPH
jgi:formate-dependent nitrite reductase cytochrome c552 subunit